MQALCGPGKEEIFWRALLRLEEEGDGLGFSTTMDILAEMVKEGMTVASLLSSLVQRIREHFSRMYGLEPGGGTAGYHHSILEVVWGGTRLYLQSARDRLLHYWSTSTSSGVRPPPVLAGEGLEIFKDVIGGFIALPSSGGNKDNSTTTTTTPATATDEAEALLKALGSVFLTSLSKLLDYNTKADEDDGDDDDDDESQFSECSGWDTAHDIFLTKNYAIIKALTTISHSTPLLATIITTTLTCPHGPTTFLKRFPKAKEHSYCETTHTSKPALHLCLSFMKHQPQLFHWYVAFDPWWTVEFMRQLLMDGLETYSIDPKMVIEGLKVSKGEGN